MSTRENVSKLFPVLLDESTTDATLVGKLEGFLETIRPPTFPVEQKTIKIGQDDLTWESMTTDLVGFEFGDVVRDRCSDCLRRVIAHDKEGYVWVTSKQNRDAVIKTMLSPGRFERYAPDDAALCDRLSSILSDGGGGGLADRVVAEIKKIPQFPVAQNGLQIWAVGENPVFGWDDMTVNLAARGLAFGDVVVDETRNRLHRVVAYKDDKLWITSARTENRIVYDPSPDDFVKYPEA